MITASEAKAETRDRNLVVQEQVTHLLEQLQAQVATQAAAGFHSLTLTVNAEADILVGLTTALVGLGYTTSGDANQFTLSWS